jgi:hypothetical protein
MAGLGEQFDISGRIQGRFGLIDGGRNNERV